LGAAISWYSVGSIITLHDQITAREYMDGLGNRHIPMIQTLFPNNAAISKIKMPPFTQLELFSHGLKSMKSMKVNFNIFPGQQNHQI
jgi:hypothetical protein